jgi:heme/copper-type cytochrome/quinol oxidase subunit 1
MHYVLLGTAVFGFFSGVYFWFPKFTGRMLGEVSGRSHFWLTFVGFNLTFWPHHLLGLRGMPRRIATYPSNVGWNWLNLVSTVGAFIIATGTIVFCWNFFVSLRRGRPAGDDPWGGYSLEWATSSPPPEHNFHHLPPVRSERPTFDARQAAAAGAGRS